VANNPATARLKDGATTSEYESEELSDSTLHRVVEQAYKTFRVRLPSLLSRSVSRRMVI
jgi:hypothetical protein